MVSPPDGWSTTPATPVPAAPARGFAPRAARSALFAAARRDLARNGLVYAAASALTLACRLPFVTQTDKDEIFFSIIAERWAHGQLPYVASFDVKPPGLFFVFWLAQILLPASLAVIKGLEIAAVIASAVMLFRMVDGPGRRAAAIWAALIFPVYSICLAGVDSVSMVLIAPCTIAGFGGMLRATDPDSSPRQGLSWSLIAGLAIGMAGTIRQTAAFDAIGVAALPLMFARDGRLLGKLAAFAVGAVAPIALFCAYFAGVGHFAEFYRDAITLAAQRTAPDVLASYGPSAPWAFSLTGLLVRSELASAPLLLIWAGALLAIARYRAILGHAPTRLYVAALIWLATAILGALSGKLLCEYYLIATIPPLILLTALFLASGFDPGSAFGGVAARLAVATGLALAAIVPFEAPNLLNPAPILAGDYAGEQGVADLLARRGFDPARDSLLVVNRGYRIYLASGGRPPGRYFHATHLLGVFHAATPDPLGEALADRPAWIVVADPRTRHVTEMASAFQRIARTLQSRYALAGAVTGARDRFFVYGPARAPGVAP